MKKQDKIFNYLKECIFWYFDRYLAIAQFLFMHNLSFLQQPEFGLGNSVGFAKLQV